MFYIVIWLSAIMVFFFFSSRRRHTRSLRDWSSDVCSSDLDPAGCRALRGLRDVSRHRQRRGSLAHRVVRVVDGQAVRSGPARPRDGLANREAGEPFGVLLDDLNPVHLRAARTLPAQLDDALDRVRLAL